MVKIGMAFTLVFILTTYTPITESSAQSSAKGINDTGDILAKSAEIKDIEYKIMVQRATQTAIWAMPAAGMIDFIKVTRHDLGGEKLMTSSI